MFCKKCGTNINEGMGFCPNCGEPVGGADSGNVTNDNSVTNMENGSDTVNTANGTNGEGEQNPVIPPVSALWNMYPQNGQAAGGQAANTQAANGQAAGGQTGNMQSANVQPGMTQYPAAPQYGTQQNGFTKGMTMEGGGKKFFADHKIFLIVAAAVIVVLVLVLCNLRVAANFLRRTFSSPESYYHYVEKKTVEDASADFAEMYGRYFLDNLDTSGKSVSAQIDVKMGEGGQDLLDFADLAGVDMSWLESASFTMNSSVSKEAISLGLKAALNGVNIISGNAVVDLEEEALYLQLPEVNKRYMGVEFDTSDLGDMEEMWELYETLEKVCPDQKEAQQLVNRYFTTAIECVDDVTKKKSVLEAGDIEQKCTVLTVTLDEETAQKVMIAVLTQMKDDKDIEKIIKNVMAEETLVEELYLDDMSPEEAYEEFQDWVDEGLEYLEDYDDYSDDKIKMKVYVNNKGEIVGRTITAEDTTIKMLMPEKGKKFGYELSYKDSYYDESMAVTGNGTRSGDKIDGEFALEYNDISMADISVKDFNTKDARKGIINGKMTWKLSEDIEDYTGYVSGMSMIQKITVTTDFKSDKNSSKCNIGVSMKDKNLVDIMISYSKEKGYKGADPGSDAVMIDDEDDLIKWGKDFNLNGLTDALKEANVPSEVTDSLEMFEDMDIETIMDMMYYYY